MFAGCKQAILLICYIFVTIFWIGQNGTSFMGWNKIEKNQMVSLSNFELLDANIDNVMSKGIESSTKFILVVLKSSNGTKMEVNIIKENLVMDLGSSTSKG